MLRAIVLLFALAASAASALAAEPLPLDAFFSKVRIDAAALSPSGRYVATMQRNGDVSRVVVHDLQTDADTRAVALSGEEYSFD